MSEADKEARRARYLSRWHALDGEFERQNAMIIRKARALASFILARNHAHFWRISVSLVEVDGLGTHFQFHRFCYCGRRQSLIEWWNQFKEVCYNG